MHAEERRIRLASFLLEMAESSTAITQLLEQQALNGYIQGSLTLDQVLEKLEERAAENLRRIQAARVRWAKRGDPL
ncbi:hypothetical protein FNT36_18580 [Hymenobacter setariae]|uniref:Antitoxin VbhA domain-containing protein n=1 Tax=Hymenobacter setariae TaxID=2594794 RepID=A0A558BSX3_9BACT|nr:hypothetical protein [Hymenobacter setariae]TVT39648.1 hypothetical protein FNT36_18580 [Hymenobacter setariae]